MDIAQRTFELGVFMWAMGGVMVAMAIAVGVGMWLIGRSRRKV